MLEPVLLIGSDTDIVFQLRRAVVGPQVMSTCEVAGSMTASPCSALVRWGLFMSRIVLDNVRLLVLLLYE
jgi:hypothetical protein